MPWDDDTRSKERLSFTMHRGMKLGKKAQGIKGGGEGGKRNFLVWKVPGISWVPQLISDKHHVLREDRKRTEEEGNFFM